MAYLNGLSPPPEPALLMPAHVRKALVALVLPESETVLGFEVPAVIVIEADLSIACKTF